MKISKEFHWEMCHRLPDHKGLCKNIHGHTYRMDVKLKGYIAAGGMLLDYYDIHQIVTPIIEEMDHGFMVQKSDSVILAFLKANNFKKFIIAKSPTAENITEMLLEKLAPKFRVFPNLRVLKIRVYETEDTYAEAEIKL